MFRKNGITSILLYNVNVCTFCGFDFTHIGIKPVMSPWRQRSWSRNYNKDPCWDYRKAWKLETLLEGKQNVANIYVEESRKSSVKAEVSAFKCQTIIRIQFMFTSRSSLLLKIQRNKVCLSKIYDSARFLPTKLQIMKNNKQKIHDIQHN